MEITEKTWVEYITRLARLNEEAGQKMADYIAKHGTENTGELIAYASALIQKYGEGSAELACQMYDAVAEASGAAVPPAEPAEPADYGETAKMVNGTKQSPPLLASGVSRLVKLAGADTTMKNAIRDGAEWAWVPHGDTCAFCIALASRGWQRASAKALKGDHAQHMFFDRTSQYAGNFARETNETISGSLLSMQAAFKNVLGALTLGQDIGPALSALGTSVTSFLTGNLLPAISRILQQLPSALAQILETMIPQLSTALIQFIPEAVSGFAGETPALLLALTNALSNMLTTITNSLPQLVAKGAEMLLSLSSGLTASLPELIQTALNAITSFLMQIFEMMPQIISSGQNILLNLISGIQQALPSILVMAGQAISTLFTGIIQNLPQIISSGIQLVASLISGISSALPQIFQAAGEVVRQLWETIKNTDWLQLGKDIILGLINGIGAMAGALWDAAVISQSRFWMPSRAFLGLNLPHALCGMKSAGLFRRVFPPVWRSIPSRCGQHRKNWLILRRSR